MKTQAGMLAEGRRHQSTLHALHHALEFDSLMTDWNARA